MVKEFYSIKYAKYWVLVAFAKCFVLLPYKFQLKFFVFIGSLIRPFAKRRDDIVKTNLNIAFPDKSEKEIKTIADKCFKSACMAAAESLMAWFMSEKRFNKIKFSTENFSKMDESLESEKPTIVLGFHFHSLEIVGRHCGKAYNPITVMYQKHKNPFMENMISSSRKKYYHDCFQRKNIIPVIRSLRKGITMWYAPDQDFGKEHTIFIDFFGKKCSTLTATSWLATKTNSTVVPVFYVRNEDLSGYKLISGEPIDITGDVYSDSIKINEFLEKAIIEYPDQYLWQHRRYKTRPQGEEKIY